ncbi:hypothetical protein [Metabacillus sp. Hm71]|uniref:hypothetical protein n=1 Tax=Metabacillus sp. Hm71 TaxID=3450743 RepID=UPI003F429372
MGDVKALEVVFENCESIIIPIEKVKEFTYEGLTKLTHEIYEDNSYESNSISLKITYEDESELNYIEGDEPLGMFINNPTSNRVKDRPDILGRLIQHKDIVCIDLLNEKEERMKIIYVPWKIEDEYTNTLIKTKVENGLIEINISK